MGSKPQEPTVACRVISGQSELLVTVFWPSLYIHTYTLRNYSSASRSSTNGIWHYEPTGTPSRKIVANYFNHQAIILSNFLGYKVNLLTFSFPNVNVFWFLSSFMTVSWIFLRLWTFEVITMNFLDILRHLKTLSCSISSEYSTKGSP